MGDDPLNTNYSCSTSVTSVVRTIYDLGNYSDMTDDDIKDYVLDNMDSYYYFFNPKADDYEQVYRVRSFFSAGLRPLYMYYASVLHMPIRGWFRVHHTLKCM